MASQISKDSPQEPPVTSQDLLEAAGLADYRTLVRWHKGGVIPPPTKVQHPSGRGRMSSWPAWVREHCRVIRQLKDEGRSLDEIKGIFGSQWDAVARRYEGPPRPAGNSPRRKLSVGRPMDRDLFLYQMRTVIEAALISAVAETRRSLTAAELPQVTDELSRRAAELLADGYAPVIVLAGPHLRVVPDFVLPHLLTSGPTKGRPMLVVPIAPILPEPISLPGVPLPSSEIRAARKAVVCEGSQKNEVEFELTGDFEFALDRG